MFEHGRCNWCFDVKTNKTEKSCMHCIIAEKTIALVMNKRGSAGVRGYRGKVPSENLKLISVCYCPPFTSAGIFLKLENALKETCEMNLRNVSKAHCKNLPFFHMTPCLSFVQYTRLYSVLHTSQINVQWTSLSTGDVALCPDNLRPIKQTPTDDTDWLLLTWF